MSYDVPTYNNNNNNISPFTTRYYVDWVYLLTDAVLLLLYTSDLRFTFLLFVVVIYLYYI